MTDRRCSDPMIIDNWHVLCWVDELPCDQLHITRLLGEDVGYARNEAGQCYVWRNISTDLKDTQPDYAALGVGSKTQVKFGYLWATFSENPKPLFDILEYDEIGRRNIHTATLQIFTSPPRAVENFLDMAHFSYVHTDILGTPDHPEVNPYQVNIDEEQDEIWATQCKFYQPKAAATSASGIEAEYAYRVPHPYCAILYKTCASMPDKMDVLAIFVQPVDDVTVRGNLFLCLFDDEGEFNDIRAFQQTILAQDKPILENQVPKQLPLNSDVEVPVAADAVSVAYRRWLKASNIQYGTI